jgi:hypothetical protein
MNHAITGYACFLTCQNLRKSFLKFIQMIYGKVQMKPEVKCNLSTIEPTTIVLRRI